MKNLPLANKRFRTSCARAGASESGGTSENICAVRLPEPSEMTTCSRASTGRHQVRMSFLNNQTFLLIVAFVRYFFIKDIYVSTLQTSDWKKKDIFRIRRIVRLEPPCRPFITTSYSGEIANFVIEA